MALVVWATISLGCSATSTPAVIAEAIDAGTTGHSSPTAEGVVWTDKGAVQGRIEGSTWAFKGIPYAAPPINSLRWRPPEPAAAWDGIRKAFTFGPECPQKNKRDGGIEGEEDCLTLNVWTPSSDSTEPLPVLVFIHGGAHFAGASSRPLYDGRALSEFGPVVVVTINYRLGVLGFLAHASLSAESERGVSGNYGILDQTLALRWVQKNIAAFGGDPSRVLLFGQSAGAFDSCVHLASKLSKGLFSRVMVLSGGCGATPLTEAEGYGDNVATHLSCDSEPDVAACLRAKTAAEIAAVPVNDGREDSARAAPVIDGWVLEAHPLRQLAVGVSEEVPVVVSTTRDEFANQLGLYGPSRPVSSEADYVALVQQIFDSRAAEVLALYPASQYATANDALIAMMGDLNFICPSRATARAAAKGGAATYRSEFQFPERAGPLAGFAAHGIDLMFGFRNLDVGGRVPTEADLRVSDALARYWVTFAATGTPNGDGAYEWPQYEPARDNYLAIDDPLSSDAGIRTAYCDFWSSP